jgi:cellulose biosynthesis protein BcsQ
VLVNTLAVVNSKGGVGKTSVAANIAGLAARAGWHTLIADLDAQGNLSRDLGYYESSDDGQALFEAILASRPPQPRQVRPNLAVVTGGGLLARLDAALTGEHQPNPAGSARLYSLESTLAPLAGDYDLIVLDCPPSVSAPLVTEALNLARFAVIPTRCDEASIDGLAGLAGHVNALTASGGNPDLEVLGVVLFDVGATHTAIHRTARGQLEELLQGITPVLQATIRSGPRAAHDMRRLGLLAHEYEHHADQALPWHEAHRRGLQPPRFAANADGLASDYEQLTHELLEQFLQRRDALPSHTVAP